MNQSLAASVPRTSARRTWDKWIRWLGHAPLYLVLGIWSLFTVFVIGWVLLSSVKTTREVFQVWNLPKVLQFKNYVDAWSSSNFGIYFLNSVIATGVSLVVILCISAPAAYVLSRLKFRGRGVLNLIFIGGIGIPYALVFVPLYGMMTKLGLIQFDQRLTLIIVYISLSIPFAVYILTGFFGSLPSELEEAAVIDGCTDFEVFFHVMLPLARPGIITAAIFNGLGLWNEFQLAQIFINEESKRTLSFGLYALQESMQYTGNWAGLFAGVCIVMIPTIILYVFLSERMISGITMGSVKS